MDNADKAPTPEARIPSIQSVSSTLSALGAKAAKCPDTVFGRWPACSTGRCSARRSDRLKRRAAPGIDGVMLGGVCGTP